MATTAEQFSHQVYGLIGFPLVHSFSKDFFNQKFESEGIDAEYLNFEIDDISKIKNILIDNPHLKGLNVTAPYKKDIIPYLDSVTPEAERIGAVNVVKILRNKEVGTVELRGFNSDVIGFQKSIEPLLDEMDTKAMILGTGGSARAVAFALEKLGVETMLVSRIKSATTFIYEEITKAMVAEHKLIVNATPLGTYPNIDACPDFPYRFLTSEHFCYDLVYNPDVTLFMKNSQKHGANVKNGLEMLLLQAFASYSIWTR